MGDRIETNWGLKTDLFFPQIQFFLYDFLVGNFLKKEKDDDFLAHSKDTSFDIHRLIITELNFSFKSLAGQKAGFESIKETDPAFADIHYFVLAALFSQDQFRTFGNGILQPELFPPLLSVILLL
jgi:hypothetical protein